ncbi:MAG: chemotaxis-specific protein-glutamate methyltransferase CheB [Candidatus Eisenbacteria bacterium]|nr:chemotaxis-specific protein-glutamate methyltransferase CheB [Candidatus Eisenbacteria bacterium]
MALNVLVVDDMATYRKILHDIVSPLDGVASVSTARSGPLALKKLSENTYDLILLDVQMPEMDGIETLDRISKSHPECSVVLVSAATEKGSETAIHALNLGALDIIEKPHGKSVEENIAKLQTELNSVLKMLETRIHTRSIMGKLKTITQPSSLEVMGKPKIVTFPPKRRHPFLIKHSFGLLAIGSSTGGPVALAHVIPHLPPDLPVPVVLVQHMPPVFTEALAKDLNKKSKIYVKEATQGDLLSPGTVYIAPGGRHMTIGRGPEGFAVDLSDGPPVNSCRPAIDVLFQSLTKFQDTKSVLAVIMTGMGADGLNGVETLKGNGCYCLAQSAKTCVVYGMPQAVDNAGLTDESIDLDELGPRIVELLIGGLKR